MRFKSEQQLKEWMAQAGTALPSKKLRQELPAQTIDISVQRRIIGVDTALRCTGWGIIDIRGQKMRAVDCGVIRNPATDKMSDCLRRLAEGIRQLAQLYKPQIAVLEGAFFCRNVRTAMVLGSARGAVISTLAEQGIEIYEYAPRKVKQTVCGFGNASKEQVARMVSSFLNIKTEDFPLDATDALAMAICHAQQLSIAKGYGLPPQV